MDRALRRRLLACGVVLGVAGAPPGAPAAPPAEPPGSGRPRLTLGCTPPDLPARTLELALCAYEHARARGEVTVPILSIIDYTLPSTAKRLWVLDLERGVVLFHELVAHGRSSGDNEARAFGNQAGCHRSCLGVFRTGTSYRGQHGI